MAAATSDVAVWWPRPKNPASDFAGIDRRIAECDRRAGKMEIRLLLVPYDSGQRNVRMGAGPEYLRAAGLREKLVARGHAVDAQVIEPTSMKWQAEVQTSFELMRAVADGVRKARAAGRFP